MRATRSSRRRSVAWSARTPSRIVTGSPARSRPTVSNRPRALTNDQPRAQPAQASGRSSTRANVVGAGVDRGPGFAVRHALEPERIPDRLGQRHGHVATPRRVGGGEQAELPLHAIGPITIASRSHRNIPQSRSPRRAVILMPRQGNPPRAEYQLGRQRGADRAPRPR